MIKIKQKIQNLTRYSVSSGLQNRKYNNNSNGNGNSNSYSSRDKNRQSNNLSNL